ncbi:sugar transporter [Colletotrichum sojae]|uniref:Sugar transporter n=1 Tax=Colletotrichum sojae TaxID=2175907 RepID=A0A8H6MMX6_9PEZI|nr:sugar transporter [Colletotrichum sojae]
MQVVKSELPHTSLRDKSVMLPWSVVNACNFLVMFTLPYLIQPEWKATGLGSALTRLENGGNNALEGKTGEVTLLRSDARRKQER